MGVRVAGQPHPSTHRCEGVEVKTALVYPQQAPRARTRLAGVMKPELLPQLPGLLRAAGVQGQDEVVGVSGAVWIEQLYQTLGIPQVIDVFHASQYLEQVMLELGWSAEERRRWLRGEVAGGEWLGTLLPLSGRAGRKRPAAQSSTWSNGPIGWTTRPTKPGAGPSVQARWRG